MDLYNRSEKNVNQSALTGALFCFLFMLPANRLYQLISLEDGSMGKLNLTDDSKAVLEKQARVPSTLEASLALLISFVVVIIGIRLKAGMSAPLIAGAFAAGLFGVFFGFRWKDLQSAMTEGITNALPAIIILMLVGMIIGIWIIGGTVPTMVYYGLKLLNPKMFLAATFLLCSIVSTATGTSFGTVGTIGLALIGIGEGLGLPLPMVAGAIISGAYFGDKMSPLSDTTNVAPAMAGAELFDHIGSMLYTTLPAFIIALILYAILGIKFGGENVDIKAVNDILAALEGNFNLSLLTLIPPLLVIVMSLLRFPAIPSLTAAVAFSIIWAMIMQGADFKVILGVSMDGYVGKTGLASIDKLLTRGGLNSMMATNALILIAAAFGGILEKIGVLSTVVNSLLKKVKSSGGLILSVLISCYLILLVTGNVMMAIILPGRTFKDVFAERGIAPRVLSRTLEDAGTIGGALVPWSVAGLLIFGVLKVPVLSYAPYAFLNWMVPVFSIIYGYTGFAIFKAKANK